MTPFTTSAITIVAPTGDLTQVYIPSMTAGSGATTSGTLVRKPLHGIIHSFEVQSDGTNGGTVELWDLDGNDGGANVNTGTAITNAQLVVAQARGKARLMWSKNFAGSAGSYTAKINNPMPFQHGVAIRFQSAAPVGSAQGNFNLSGGGVKQPISG